MDVFTGLTWQLVSIGQIDRLVGLAKIGKEMAFVMYTTLLGARKLSNTLFSPRNTNDVK
jgi:hypothetical protein